VNNDTRPVKNDTWTRAVRNAVRWFCSCGRLNPETTATCLGCGQ
jgi:hypothetical protein